MLYIKWRLSFDEGKNCEIENVSERFMLICSPVKIGIITKVSKTFFYPKWKNIKIKKCLLFIKLSSKYQ